MTTMAIMDIQLIGVISEGILALWAVVNTRNCGPDVQVSYG
jgi:hypothetical protein